MLCQAWEHLNVLPVTRTFLESCIVATDPDDLSIYDRIIIHTDGSSCPLDRHKSAAWNDDHLSVDSWAFIAVGEVYAPDSSHPSTFSLLGWTAQKVVVGERETHFAGATRLGSDVAEQEGLLWAGLWRLAHNISTPTTFVSDSQLALGQAQGQLGTAHTSDLFANLRGVFQALQCALVPEALTFHHTYGHSEDPLNEFVDVAARDEREQGHRLPRQRIDMQTWNCGLPYLWMKFDSRAGLPPIANDCLLVLPVESPSARAIIYAELKDDAYNVPDLVRDTMPPKPDIFSCMQCRLSFKSRAGMGAHFFRVHGRIAQCRHYFDRTECGACLKQFHTAAKLKAHLQHSTHCLNLLRGARHHCIPLPGIGSSADAALVTSHDGLCPVQQGFGPAPPLQRSVEADGVHWDLHAILVEDILMETTTDGLRDRWQHSIYTTEVSWDQMCLTLQQIVFDYTLEDAEASDFVATQIQEIVDYLCDPSHWPHLASLQTVCEDTELWHWEETYATICTRDFGLYKLRPSPARPIGRERYVLHAYAGRRRYGDIQFYLDRMAKTHDDVCLRVLSVDVVIDPHLGDLMDQNSQTFWLRAIRDRLIVGLLAGPPCNTFSRVRKVALQNSSHRAPRAVRSPQHPWGLPSLCLRELCQVMTGNALFIFALRALYTLLQTDGCGLVEHPDEAGDEDVSVWRIPIVAALRRSPEVDFLHATQGYHGSEGLKPTGLLALRLPGLHEDLQQGKLAAWHHQGATHGQDSTGAYHSAKLKEYPPAFCRAIATTFDRALTARSVDGGIVFPDSFREISERFMSFSKGAGLGPDFHRTA
eukprot:Skav201958  [mRNA]  locus=scaffold103:202287:208105:+ [translate_table: standard]